MSSLIRKGLQFATFIYVLSLCTKPPAEPTNNQLCIVENETEYAEEHISHNENESFKLFHLRIKSHSS